MLYTAVAPGESVKKRPRLMLFTVVVPGESEMKRPRLMLFTVVVLGVGSEPSAFATSRDSVATMRLWGTEADTCLRSCQCPPINQVIRSLHCC